MEPPGRRSFTARHTASMGSALLPNAQWVCFRPRVFSAYDTSFSLRAYGDSMRKYARSRRKLAKAGRPSENMHAARRCDGCEKMQTVTNTVLGSQSFTSSDKRQSSPHPNFLLLAAWCTACRLSDCELSTRENLCVVQGISVRVLVGRVSCFTGRVCENVHPPPRQNRPTCENMHWRLPGSGLRKYALRQNHTIPV